MSVQSLNILNYVIRWRLRVVMAEINLSNKELAAVSGIHPVTVSNLKRTDSLTQISGDVLNKLCNGLTIAYRRKGIDTIITPSELIAFTPDIPKEDRRGGRRAGAGKPKKVDEPDQPEG